MPFEVQASATEIDCALPEYIAELVDKEIPEITAFEIVKVADLKPVKLEFAFAVTVTVASPTAVLLSYCTSYSLAKRTVSPALTSLTPTSICSPV